MDEDEGDRSETEPASGADLLAHGETMSGEGEKQLPQEGLHGPSAQHSDGGSDSSYESDDSSYISEQSLLEEEGEATVWAPQSTRSLKR